MTCPCRGALLACLLMLPGFAAEYRGSVRASGLPLPGAAVTATRGDQKLTTTTDESGVFSFRDLPDGEWTVEVQSLGFAPLRKTVTTAAGATTWDLIFLPKDALIAALNPGGRQNVAPVPAPRRGPQQPTQIQPVQQGPDFQRVDVTQAADTQAFATEGAIRTEDATDLNQSAANSFLVQGSLSSAVGLPQQNDWGFGRPMGPDGMMGPPGMMGMLGGPGGMAQTTDGPPTGQTGPAGMSGRAPGGPGGPGMGPGGGPGGFRGPGGPGGFGGPGGPGGFGGRGPGMGDRRSAAAGRPGTGRPEWQGRRDATAFGNNRRSRQLQYMGMAMFNLNDDSLDARAYSVTGANVVKPDYSNLRGGVMFGGPLQIPKLISANRQIMFTFNYEFGRNRTGTVSDPVNMPTLLERAGDFSQTVVGGQPVTIFDPLTGTPFPNNQLPASRINGTSAELLQFFPEPNLPFAVRNYQKSWTSENDTHNINARVMNVRISPKDRLNGSIGYQHSSNLTPNIFDFIDTGAGRGINTGLGWSRNITTRLINNVQVSFSRMRQQAIPFFAGVRDVATELGIEGTSGHPMNWGPPTLQFTNYAGLRDGNFSLNRNQTTTIGDSLIWIHGSHNYTFGGNFRRLQFNQIADANGRGTWSFNGDATSNTVAGIPQAGTGYDLADFLLGRPTTSSIRYGNADKYLRNTGVDLFINDDWRIHPKLSINVGMRWDLATPTTELYGRLVNLAIAPGFTAIAPVTNPRIQPDRNNISPRFGFAYRPSGRRAIVIRGGYGIYYNTSVYNTIAMNMAQQPPFAEVLNVSSTPLDPLFLDNGFVASSTIPGTSTYAIDPYYRIGYAQTWTVSVQRDLPLGLFGTAGYLGTKGTRLDQQFLPNSVAPGARPSNLPQGFIYQMSNGNSIYHAAQFQLNRRFRSGFGANSSYQFSKSIDNAGTGGRGQGGTPIAQNWLDYSAERGLSSFDSRHNLSVQAQYSTGMGTRGGTLLQGWKGALLKDWTISSMLTLRSGNPFTATVGGSRSQVLGTSVNNTVRANATGLPIEAAGMLFNTAAFSAPLPGQWGNAGRNTIPGPTVLFLNGGVGRIFRLGERRSVDIQMQGQNVLNHVVITGWGTVLGANNYGLASNAAPMRRINLSVRFRF